MTDAGHSPRSADPVDVVLALHLQNDVLHAGGKIRVGLDVDDPRRAKVIAAAGELLAAARARGCLIVFVRIAFAPDFSDVIQNCAIFRSVVKIGACAEGSWGAAFHDGLQPAESVNGSGNEIVITHKRVNAFQGTDLEQRLAALNVRRIVAFGVATNSVVEHSARHASDLGYPTVVARDACATSDATLHAASLRNLEYVCTIADNPTVIDMLGRP